MTSIPIISIGRSFDASDSAARARVGSLCEALARIGFAYIADHGVEPSVVEAAFVASRRFHASPMALKQSLAINEFHRGYMGIATSTIVTSSVAKVTKPNLSESLMVMHELAADDPDLLQRKPLQGPNQWPHWLPEFRPIIETYIARLEALARRLIRMIATGIGLRDVALDSYFVKPTTFLRLLHYPPQPPDTMDGQYGSAPHTDYGIITILAQDEQGGLQVKPRDRDWIDASPIPGTFVLNVADMLARWTNHKFTSTPHRVVNRSGGDRYSLPFFFDTGMDAIIECLPSCRDRDHPPLHPPVRYGDYLMERIDKNYSYRRATAGSRTDASG